jgi:hypothetical protein
MPPQDLLFIPEAAKLMGVSRQRVHELIALRKLKEAGRVNGRRVVYRAEVAVLIGRRATTGSYGVGRRPVRMMPRYTADELAAMEANARAKVRYYAQRRDELLREGVSEGEAQARAADEANDKYASPYDING